MTCPDCGYEHVCEAHAGPWSSGGWCGTPIGHDEEACTAHTYTADEAAAAEAAFKAHIDEHGCGCPRYDRGCDDPRHVDGHTCRGFAHCSTAWELFCGLPVDQQVIVG